MSVSKTGEYIVSVDSGAHSFYNLYHKNRHSSDQAEYHKSPEFKKYLDKYIAFLLAHEDKINMYITLDVINNAKATWDILKYMESEGLKPVPVFHRKSEMAWLHKLIDNYEYIAIGGLGQSTSYGSYRYYGDHVFKALRDSKGRPRVRIHGLAMTGRANIMRYPWYSVDSATWIRNAYVGSLAVPQISLEGEINWGHFYWIAVTDRRTHEPKHILNLPPVVKTLVLKHMNNLGLSLDVMRQPDTEGLTHRSVFNMLTFLNIGKSAREYIQTKWGYDGGNMMLAGSCVVRHHSTALPLVQKLWGAKLHVFETFFHARNGTMFDKLALAIRHNRVRLRRR